MTRIIRIDSCESCPHCRNMLKYAYCVNNTNIPAKYWKIEKIDTILADKYIPEWCPLEEYKNSK